MGGCSILIFLPLIFGAAAAIVIVKAALWIYLVYATVVLVLSIVGYAIAARRGLFTRFRDDAGWKHYAALALLWFLRFEIAFYLITAIATIAAKLYFNI